MHILRRLQATLELMCSKNERASRWAVVSHRTLAFGGRPGEFDYFHKLISTIAKIAKWYGTFRFSLFHFTVLREFYR